MLSYTGPIVLMRPGDRDFVGSVLVTVALAGVLVAGDLYLRSILLKDSRRGPAWVRIPEWLAGERLPRWQRRVVALLVLIPMALEDLALAIAVLIGERISWSAEARSLAWSVVPAVGCGWRFG